MCLFYVCYVCIVLFIHISIPRKCHTENYEHRWSACHFLSKGCVVSFLKSIYFSLIFCQKIIWWESRSLQNWSVARINFRLRFGMCFKLSQPSLKYLGLPLKCQGPLNESLVSRFWSWWINSRTAAGFIFLPNLPRAHLKTSALNKSTAKRNLSAYLMPSSRSYNLYLQLGLCEYCQSQWGYSFSLLALQH